MLPSRCVIVNCVTKVKLIKFHHVRSAVWVSLIRCMVMLVYRKVSVMYPSSKRYQSLQSNRLEISVLLTRASEILSHYMPLTFSSFLFVILEASSCGTFKTISQSLEKNIMFPDERNTIDKTIWFPLKHAKEGI